MRERRANRSCRQGAARHLPDCRQLRMMWRKLLLLLLLDQEEEARVRCVRPKRHDCPSITGKTARGA